MFRAIIFFSFISKKILALRSLFGIMEKKLLVGDNMILRPDYVNEILKYIDTPLVKIVSGVRRCGNISSYLSIVLPINKL